MNAHEATAHVLSDRERERRRDEEAAAELRRRCFANTADMMAMCLRDERRRELVLVAPHQQVGAEFLDYHDRSVHIWPINHAKTATWIGFALRMIARNPNSRGAFLSATQAQAAKNLRVVRDIIGDHRTPGSPEFHWLCQGPDGRSRIRRGRQWTDTAFTVERDPGIKDPTLVACGIDGGLPGARLDWVIFDDLLNAENTNTQAGRDKVWSWAENTGVSRVEANGKIAFGNSAWHANDALHRYEAQGYATLRMSVDGEIYVKDDIAQKERGVFWDSPSLVNWPGGDASLGDRVRIASDVQERYERQVFARTGQRPSPDHMLWNPHPVIPSLAWIEKRHPLPFERTRLYYSRTRHDGAAWMKEAWVTAAKQLAQTFGIRRMPKRTIRGGLVTIGVDLAFSKKKLSADTVIFALERLPTGHRVPLEIRIGKFTGPETIAIIAEMQAKYDAFVRVENNGAQDYLLQFVKAEDAAIPIFPHTTGLNKARTDYGVPSVFAEFATGAWVLPCGPTGLLEPELERFVQAMLNYTPEKHTDDVLMAAWFAREQMREFGAAAGADALEGGPRP